MSDFLFSNIVKIMDITLLFEENNHRCINDNAIRTLEELCSFSLYDMSYIAQARIILRKNKVIFVKKILYEYDETPRKVLYSPGLSLRWLNNINKKEPLRYLFEKHRNSEQFKIYETFINKLIASSDYE